MSGKPLMSFWRCPECGEKSVLYETTREEWEPGGFVCQAKGCDYTDYASPDPSPEFTAMMREAEERNKQRKEGVQ